MLRSELSKPFILSKFYLLAVGRDGALKLNCLMSIIKKHEHNFRHNAMFPGVTLKGIMLEFSSIIDLTLMQRTAMKFDPTPLIRPNFMARYAKCHTK